MGSIMSASHTRRKEFSQNFLHCSRLIARLVANSSLGPHDLVLEIGPGDGAITAELIRTCRHVLAVERDANYVGQLQRTLGESGGFTLFAADFLDFPLPSSRYKVFANIPYSITAAIVGKLTSGTSPPEDAYLVVQREAADRFLGTPVGTLVSAHLAPWFELSVEHHFRRGDFRPAPGVDSVLVRISKRTAPLISTDQRDIYLDFVAAAFTAWKATSRDAIASVLPERAVMVLDRELGAALDCRPSEMDPRTWVEAFLLLAESDDRRVWNKVKGARVKLDQRNAQLSKRTRTTVARRR